MRQTLPHLSPSGFPPLARTRPHTLQINLGRLCNLQCLHCHVAAGPNRPERMDRATLDLVMATLDRLSFETLDLTGCAGHTIPTRDRHQASRRVLRTIRLRMTSR